MPEHDAAFATIDSTVASLAGRGYISGRPLATAIYLAIRLGKPLFLEGESGVGKTEVARTLAAITGGELIRLQCYEGLDTQTALYDWNYPRQMLELRLQEARGLDKEQIGTNIFSEAFLLERPLLRAIRATGARPPVLLIDEIDRSDAEFEAFLLELLADFQVTIPEIGTLQATQRPIVILTSNRTRELHGALKRRCLYCWIDYPDVATEAAIVRARIPGIDASLATALAFFMQRLREEDIYKRPGVAETLDWAQALLALGVVDELAPAALEATVGCILKYKGDIDRLQVAGLATLLADAKEARAIAESPTTR